MSTPAIQRNRPAAVRGRVPEFRSAANCEYPVLAKRIPLPVRWSLLFFVSALLFDEINVSFMPSSSMSRFAGFIFFGFYVLYYGPLSGSRSLPRITKAMWWFLGYLVVFALNVVFIDQEFMAEFITESFTLIQLALFVWITADLLADESMTRSALFVFSITSSFIAVAMLLQLPGFYERVDEGRVTVLGDNPNALGINMALSLVIIVGLCLYASYRHGVSKVFLALLTIPLLVTLVATGSRGAGLTFVAGCLVYIVPHRHSKRILIAGIVAALLLAGAVYKVSTTPEILERWQDSYYEGNTAGREEIFSEALGMIYEKPLLGWGPVEWFYELGRRLNRITGRDAHNTWLALLLQVGVVGAIPFAIGFWLSGRSAWKGRHAEMKLLPLALFLALFVTGMSGNLLKSKTQWFVVALTLAHASAKRELPKRIRASVF
jgi:O-antigen ligase